MAACSSWSGNVTSMMATLNECLLILWPWSGFLKAVRQSPAFCITSMKGSLLDIRSSIITSLFTCQYTYPSIHLFRAVCLETVSPWAEVLPMLAINVSARSRVARNTQFSVQDVPNWGALVPIASENSWEDLREVSKAVGSSNSTPKTLHRSSVRLQFPY